MSEDRITRIENKQEYLGMKADAYLTKMMKKILKDKPDDLVVRV